jgi:pyruvate dehydrogenase E1 component alpha subunit
MDIIAVHQSVKFAKQWVSAGKGPLLMEFVTYRYGGHSWVTFPIAIITFY